MSLLVLSAADVDALASEYSSEELRLLMADTFSKHFAATTLGQNITLEMPHRLSLSSGSFTSLFMPASMPVSSGSGVTTAVKVVCVPKDGGSKGLPATTMVLDEQTGSIRAIVNARKLTALRNAAGSLLSFTIVMPRPPRKIVAFGAGQQIEAHLQLFLKHFSGIGRCAIFNREVNDRLRRLKSRLASQFPNVLMEIGSSVALPDDPGTAEIVLSLSLRAADIIICATPSTEPLFPSQWVADGTHVILIGSYKPEMREVDNDLIYRSPKPGGVLMVDSREACLQEAGEIISASVPPEQLQEIGGFVLPFSNGQAYYMFQPTPQPDGPRVYGTEGSVTIYKSVGLAIQDVAIASAIVDRAILTGKSGTVLMGYDA